MSDSSAENAFSNLPRTTEGALHALRFDNRFVRELPSDPLRDTRRRQVAGACYSYVSPTPVRAPSLVAHAREVMALLDLPEDIHAQPVFAEVFGGNALLPEMVCYAACYGGHQFGNWAGQLGDGRAIGLGEVVHARGERYELQLKGAGPTPYSRTADGRAVMRSSVREFLCSEAMFHLGVPTTRALSLVATGERVMRDMFYDGRGALEPGAVVCRVAPSFLRFGNYQIFAARGDVQTLEKLLHHTIAGHFPELGAPNKDSYVKLLIEVATSTARLISQWQRVGFVHGVMNTDNMSILGLTLDYGPYGFIEPYEPDWTPNTTDAHGRRYCFGNQPSIGFWNVARFAEALLPLVGDARVLEQALLAYPETFEREQRENMRKKLGLLSYRADEDDVLVEDLFELLGKVETDMTIFFRLLAQLTTHAAAEEQVTLFLPAFYDASALDGEHRTAWLAWLSRYLKRLREQDLPDAERRSSMNAVNPKFLLRNYVAQLAIDRAEQGDYQLVRELLEVLRHPYDEQPEHAEYAEKRPEWARQRAGCSMLSCSS